MTTKTDLQQLQEFVRNKCAGETLERILITLPDFRASKGPKDMLLIADDDNRHLVWWWLESSFNYQSEETQIAIARLLGWKGGEDAK
jgi:hypothetical protein